MSSAKIQRWEANAIAEKISEKAFEHLIAPLEGSLKELVQEEYDLALVNLGMSPDVIEDLERATVIRMRPGCTVTWVNADGDYLGSFDLGVPGLYRYGDTPEPGDKWISKTLQISSHMSWARVRSTLEQYQSLVSKRGEMKSDVVNQMVGKRATSVVKAWPEVALFVQDYFNIDLVKGAFTVPFESLVRKYLVALPAPEAETV